MVNVGASCLNKNIFKWPGKYAKANFKDWVYKTMDSFRSNTILDLLDITNGSDKHDAVHKLQM